MSEKEELEIKRGLKIINDSFDEIIIKISKNNKKINAKKGDKNGSRNLREFWRY